MIGYWIYVIFFRKEEETEETSGDTMLVTYHPRGSNGAMHEPHRKLTPGAIRLMEKNPKVPKPFDANFIDKNTEEIHFTEV
jgi:hypothetical protein